MRSVPNLRVFYISFASLNLDSHEEALKAE